MARGSRGMEAERWNFRMNRKDLWLLSMLHSSFYAIW